MKRLSPLVALLAAPLAALPLALLPGAALAQDGLNGANTSWILTSTALVLFMTLPACRCFTPAWCGPRTCCRC